MNIVVRNVKELLKNKLFKIQGNRNLKATGIKGFADAFRAYSTPSNVLNEKINENQSKINELNNTINDLVSRIPLGYDELKLLEDSRKQVERLVSLNEYYKESIRQVQADMVPDNIKFITLEKDTKKYYRRVKKANLKAEELAELRNCYDESRSLFIIGDKEIPVSNKNRRGAIDAVVRQYINLKEAKKFDIIGRITCGEDFISWFSLQNDEKQREILFYLEQTKFWYYNLIGYDRWAKLYEQEPEERYKSFLDTAEEFGVAFPNLREDAQVYQAKLSNVVIDNEKLLEQESDKTGIILTDNTKMVGSSEPIIKGALPAGESYVNQVRYTAAESKSDLVDLYKRKFDLNADFRNNKISQEAYNEEIQKIQALIEEKTQESVKNMKLEADEKIKAKAQSSLEQKTLENVDTVGSVKKPTMSVEDKIVKDLENGFYKSQMDALINDPYASSYTRKRINEKLLDILMSEYDATKEQAQKLCASQIYDIRKYVDSMRKLAEESELSPSEPVVGVKHR